MLPDEVREAVESWAIVAAETPGAWQAVRVETLAAVRAHLLAREAEVERLQAIERERWDVVATRNAAVMRAEKAEALLRRHQSADVDADTTLYGDTEAHLSENSRG